MQWDRLLSSDRPYPSSVPQTQPESRPDPRYGRSDFQRDIDRIIFSDHFRRLARKTQVHPLNENDHLHSRLTHSLETSSVGRSLGEEVGYFLQDLGELPADVLPHQVGQLVHAACLAHDIGNPPFGHSGENAIKDWFKDNHRYIDDLPPEEQSDFTRFDGNAMSFRILASTGFVRTGMNMTYALLGTLLKYPWLSAKCTTKDKFNFFQSEKNLMGKLQDELGLLGENGVLCRHPLAYLTEAADDICYRIIDIEDATEVGILEHNFMVDSFRHALDLSQDKYEKYLAQHFRQRNSRLRATLINRATQEVVAAFKQHYAAIMDGSFDPGKGLMDIGESGVCREIYDLYDSIEDRLFLSKRKIILEIGAQNTLGVLLETIMREADRACSGNSAAGRGKLGCILGKDLVDDILQREKSRYWMCMAALDYVSGMSDHYAAEMSRKFMGLN